MKTIVAIIAALTLTGGAVIADEASQPKVISDGDLDKIVAGVGRNNVAGFPQPWNALLAAGFSPTANGNSHVSVTVPRK
jgi:hypothetical protein